MIEAALSLGPERNLVTVVTEPTGQPKPLAVLLLNAGVVHRIGPHRTSVKLARHLARQGYTTLRFDASGVGDSRVPRDAAPYKEQASLDIRAVMDHMEREHGIARFALFGICSGAHRAYEMARVDERVAGIFLFDGYAYPTFRMHMIQYQLRIRRLTARRMPGVVVRHTFGALTRAFGGTDVTKAAQSMAMPAVRPPKREYGRAIQQIVDRGVQVAMAFSGSVFLEYSYARQLHDAFKGRGFVEKIRCHHVPEIDHLVSSLPSQRRLVRLVEEWLEHIPD